MWYRLKSFLRNFMYGRYGNDTLNYAIMILWLVLATVNLFAHSLILYLIYTALLVLSFYRMLSRKVAVRSRENAKFLQLLSAARGRAARQRSRAADKSHKYIKCKTCGAQLRVRREKGKHTVKCPKCGGKFDVRIL